MTREKGFLKNFCYTGLENIQRSVDEGWEPTLCQCEGHLPSCVQSYGRNGNIPETHEKTRPDNVGKTISTMSVTYKTLNTFTHTHTHVQSFRLSLVYEKQNNYAKRQIIFFHEK